MELLLIINGLVAVIVSNFIKKDRWVFRGIMILLFALHIIFQGARWQMSIVYGFVFLMLYEVIKYKNVETYKKWSGSLWILGFLVSLTLIYLFPYNQMPDFTDGQLVGTYSFDIVDLDRIELYGDRASDNRKIRVQMWYPIEDQTDLKIAKWLYDGNLAAKGIPKVVGMPGFLLSHLGRIDSNSYLGGSLVIPEEPYPVVIISHGWTGFRNLHSDLAERLAANGYISVSIDHTYGALGTVFDDGSVALVDLQALPSADLVDDFSYYSNRLVSTYSKDAGLLIDTLEQMNLGNYGDDVIFQMFENNIDIDRIGIVGHSTGGGGATMLAINDSRVDVLIGYDPWVEPIGAAMLEKGVATPSLYISSEEWAGGANETYLQIIDKAPDTVTQMYQLNGTNHQDFTMLYMLEPINQIIGYAGSLDSQRCVKIVQDMTLDFLDWYLKGEKKQFNPTDQYPEIEYLW